MEKYDLLFDKQLYPKWKKNVNYSKNKNLENVIDKQYIINKIKGETINFSYLDVESIIISNATVAKLTLTQWMDVNNVSIKGYGKFDKPFIILNSTNDLTAFKGILVSTINNGNQKYNFFGLEFNPINDINTFVLINNLTYNSIDYTIFNNNLTNENYGTLKIYALITEYIKSLSNNLILQSNNVNLKGFAKFDKWYIIVNCDNDSTISKGILFSTINNGNQKYNFFGLEYNALNNNNNFVLLNNINYNNNNITHQDTWISNYGNLKINTLFAENIKSINNNNLILESPNIFLIATNLWLTTNTFSITSNELNFFARVGIGINAHNTAKLFVNGNLYVDGNIVTWQEIIAFDTATISDKFLKKNIRKLEKNDVIDKLIPVEYEFKKNNKYDVGLIAQDVEKIAPHLVVNFFSEEHNQNLKSVKYEKIIPYLILKIKELEEKISKINV